MSGILLLDILMINNWLSQKLKLLGIGEFNYFTTIILTIPFPYGSILPLNKWGWLRGIFNFLNAR